MTTLPPQLVALARGQGGVFLARQALECGLSYAELNRLLRARVLIHLRRGGYALPEAVGDDTPRTRHLLQARAALLVLMPRAWVSHQTAAMLLGLDLYDVDLSLVHVTRPALMSSRTEAGIDHHDGALPLHHRAEVDGMPVVSLGRAVIDVARSHTFDQGVVAADSALRRGLDQRDLEEALDFCRDWPGAATASQVVAFADGRAENGGESLTRCVLARGGLSPDEIQLVLPVGRHGVRVDFAWTHMRVVLEFDGKVKYGRGLAPGGDPSETAWRERQRELAIERLGWVVVRVTWAEVVFHPEVVIARVREGFAQAVARGLVGRARRAASV